MHARAGRLLGCLGGGWLIEAELNTQQKNEELQHRQQQKNSYEAHLSPPLLLKLHNSLFLLGVFMNELLDASISMIWKFGIFIIAFAALIAFIQIKAAKLERRLADKRRRKRIEADMRFKEEIREKLLQERRERRAKERRGE